MAITPTEALKLISAGDTNVSLIDVRSEGEFNDGHIPGAQNAPILKNEHRHLVGIDYKAHGQESAVHLGHELVNPIKSLVVEKWNHLSKKNTLVYCWRGGLRSKISCDWMKDAGIEATRIEAGYKGLRRVLLATLKTFPEFLVMSGMTGSGKTMLLQEFSQSLDLEKLARHRGSAFGYMADRLQPAQQDFENALGLYFLRRPRLTLIEDESRNIGRVILPPGMYEFMATCKSVIVDESVEKRSQNIFEQYVIGMAEQGLDNDAIHKFFQDCLKRIYRQLGGLYFAQISELMGTAFNAGLEDREKHCLWISRLLTDYYDKLYSYSLAKKKDRPVLFRGSAHEVKSFVANYLRNKGA